jgi:tetratricopeptide (TPR) repeat protein
VAVDLLRRAVVSDSTRADLHASLAKLTGPAPRADSLSPQQALALAEAHPYDPWALVRAAEALEGEERNDLAVAKLQRVVWLADRDPSAAAVALTGLARLDAGWAGLRIVPVHVFADESVRRHPGWKFRMRTLWLAVSQSLDPFLRVRFVVASIQGFESGGLESVPLEVFDAGFDRVVSRDRRSGIFAAFTERPRPAVRTWKQGLAEFLGSKLSVRLEPGDVQSRTLAHEILHLYGAIHVVEEIDSLMNPSGDAMSLDRRSAQILQVMRTRGFETGNFRRDVIQQIDVPKAIEAYEDALAVNLAYRRMGLQEARATARTSRARAARRARKVQKLDPHLADVLVTLARFLNLDGRPAEALPLLEAASQLYGLETRRGRAVGRDADTLRQQLVEIYGVE